MAAGTGIDQLYQEKKTDCQRIRSMQEENTRLKLDGVTYRCEKLDCGLRVPPNAYTPKIKPSHRFSIRINA